MGTLSDPMLSAVAEAREGDDVISPPPLLLFCLEGAGVGTLSDPMLSAVVAADILLLFCLEGAGVGTLSDPMLSAVAGATDNTDVIAPPPPPLLLICLEGAGVGTLSAVAPPKLSAVAPPPSPFAPFFRPRKRGLPCAAASGRSKSTKRRTTREARMMECVCVMCLCTEIVCGSLCQLSQARQRGEMPRAFTRCVLVFKTIRKRCVVLASTSK